LGCRKNNRVTVSAAGVESAGGIASCPGFIQTDSGFAAQPQCRQSHAAMKMLWAVERQEIITISRNTCSNS
jgi:hypothetical protein